MPTLLEKALQRERKTIRPASKNKEAFDLVWAWATGQIGSTAAGEAIGMTKGSQNFVNFAAQTFRDMVAAGEIVRKEKDTVEAERIIAERTT